MITGALARSAILFKLTCVSAGSPQYEFMLNDLKQASANREKVLPCVSAARCLLTTRQVPWIVMTGHRPMYCSDVGEYDQHKPGAQFQTCVEPLMQVRCGIALLQLFCKT